MLHSRAIRVIRKHQINQVAELKKNTANWTKAKFQSNAVIVAEINGIINGLDTAINVLKKDRNSRIKKGFKQFFTNPLEIRKINDDE